jgi:hypothetical protein
MDTDLRDDLERSFGDGPPLDSPLRALTLGRRARRRRRAAAAAASALVAVLVAVGAGLAWPTTPSDRGVAPTRPTHAAPTPGDLDIPVDPMQAAKCASGRLLCEGADLASLIRYEIDGRLVRGYAAVRVTGRYDDVLSNAYDESSAVELHYRGRTYWILMYQRPSGGAWQSGPPDQGRSFDRWVAESMEGGGWFSYRPDPDGPGGEL